LVVLIATWLANRSILNTNQIEQEYIQKIRNLETQLGRLKAFEERNSSFFAGVLHSTLVRDIDEQSVPYNENGWVDYYQSYFPTNRRPLFEEASSPVRQFGEVSVKVFKETSDPKIRLSRLQAEASKILSEKNISTFAKDYPNSSLDVSYVDQLLPTIASIDSPKNWPEVVRWIATGGCLDDGLCYGNYTFSSTGQASYLQRPLALDYKATSVLLKQLVRTSSASEASDLLLSRARELNNQTDQQNGATLISVSALGIDLRLWDVLLLASPVVLFLLAKYTVESNLSNVPDHSPVFPRYSSPRDPLSRPVRNSVVHFGERAIWFAFIGVVFTVLFIAVAVRYNIVDLTPYGLFAEASMGISSLIYMRSFGIVEILIDSINLFCFATGLVLLTFLLKGDDQKHIEMHSFKSLRMALYIAVFGLILATGVFFKSQMLHPETTPETPHPANWSLFPGLYIGLAAIGAVIFDAILRQFNSGARKRSISPAHGLPRRKGWGYWGLYLTRLIVIGALLFVWIYYIESGLSPLNIATNSLHKSSLDSGILNAILATIVVSVTVSLVCVFFAIGLTHRIRTLALLCGIALISLFGFSMIVNP
jgi:hypothetical protein